MGRTAKPVKYAVALVIDQPDGPGLLVVQRPPDDDRLPNVWGLPAGSRREGETSEEAAVRAGREKLGVELRIRRKLGEGELDRGDHVLQMDEYEVVILSGEPAVPQPIPGVTQYVQWRWGGPDNLTEAAREGSLCSRIYLSRTHHQWTRRGRPPCK